MGDEDDPFEKYRGNAESDETMSDRMRRLRDEFPREVGSVDRAEPEA